MSQTTNYADAESEARTIVDADSHIVEPPDIWTSRLPSALRAIGPRTELVPATGHHHWVIGDQILSPVGQWGQAGWPEYPPSAPWEYEDCEDGTYDPKARLRKMDEHGIDVQILYPNLVGFYTPVLLELGMDVATLCVRAYNDFQCEWVSADPRRLIPVAVLPFWDLQASLAEMRRCVELGFTSVLFANKMEQIGLPSFVDSHWDPLYAEAQALGLPVNFHIGFASSEVTKRITLDALMQRRAAVDERRKAVGRTAATCMAQSEVLGTLLLSGLCDRFPDLKLVQVETGFGLVPFYLELLDWQCKAQGFNELKLLPSEYFKRQNYCTFWFDRVSLPLLEAYGDNFMFSTDYPHPVSLSPGPASATSQMPADWVEDAFCEIDRGVAQKALFQNAADLYHLSSRDVLDGSGKSNS